eukprot:tig00000042_g15603.t1
MDAGGSQPAADVADEHESDEEAETSAGASQQQKQQQKPKSRKARQRLARERAAAAEGSAAAPPVFLPAHAPAIESLKRLVTVSGANAGVMFEPIGFIDSVFPEKHGTPRQANLVPKTRARLQLRRDISPLYCLEGLEEYSHVWLIFVFNLNDNRRLQTKIALPRLDGEKVGVFASRSPHHPNPLGLRCAPRLLGPYPHPLLCPRTPSVVKLDRVDARAGTLYFSGIDLVDCTPILDIKPYVAYSDSIPEARSAEWMAAPKMVPVAVRWTGEAEGLLRALVPRLKFYDRFEDIKEAVEQTLGLDPRSAHSRGKHGPGGRYGMAFDRLNVVFRVVGDREVEIFDVEFWGDSRPAGPDGRPRDHHPRGGPAADGAAGEAGGAGCGEDPSAAPSAGQ